MALPTICGYAATFWELTSDFEGRGHAIRFEPGCFLDSIAGRHPKFPGRKIRALLLHNDQYEVATQADGSLELVEDAVGLLFRIHPQGEIGQIAVDAVRNGTLQGASFGTKSRLGYVTKTRDGVAIEHYRRAGLVEISLVDRGANPRACISLQGDF